MTVSFPIDEQMFNLTQDVKDDLISGKKEEDVIQKLTENGLPPMTARTLVYQFQPLLREIKAEKHRNRILSSSILTAISVLITSALTPFASQFLVWFLLCWCGVIAGTVYLLINIYGWLKTR